MALPWLRILDLALTGLEFARKTNRRSLSAALGDSNSQLTTGPAGAATSDARLATVVVAALKEAFNRDHERLEFEREQREAERRRAERLLKLELARQAGDREIGRLRGLAVTAIVSLLTTLVLAGVGSVASTAARVALGVGWACLLGAIATSFSGQSAVAAGLVAFGDRAGDPQSPTSGAPGAAAQWLLLAGLVALAVAILVR